MSFRFEFDERAFRREVERQIQPAMDQIARDMTRDLEALRVQYEGRPVAEVKPAIRQMFARTGGSISDPELTEYAEALSKGTRIHVRADRLRM